MVQCIFSNGHELYRLIIKWALSKAILRLVGFGDVMIGVCVRGMILKMAAWGNKFLVFKVCF